jgi:hypothetical protein
MKHKLKLDRLKTCLNPAMVSALESQGFFDGSAEVKRIATAGEIKSFSPGERACERYISTRGVDRDQEVLDPAGCILEPYLKNPVVMWAHDYSCPPIGKAEWVTADAYGLKSKTIYAETERADEVWQLVKGGFLQTASVGFVALQRIWQGDDGWSEAVAKYNQAWGVDLEAAGCRIITPKWVLLEYSDVPVPCNGEALTYAVAKSLNLSEAICEDLGIEQHAAPIIRPVQQDAPVIIRAAAVPTIIKLVQPALVESDTIRRLADEVTQTLRGRV